MCDYQYNLCAWMFSAGVRFQAKWEILICAPDFTANILCTNQIATTLNNDRMCKTNYIHSILMKLGFTEEWWNMRVQRAMQLASFCWVEFV